MPKVGRIYEVRMKNEPEFGGEMIVTKVTSRLIRAYFTFDAESDALEFTRTATGNIRFKSSPLDAFGNEKVYFKWLKK